MSFMFPISDEIAEERTELAATNDNLSSGRKCGSCNWEAGMYVLAETQEEANTLFLKGDAGLCGDCMCGMLAEVKHTITTPTIEEIAKREEEYKDEHRPEEPSVGPEL